MAKTTFMDIICNHAMVEIADVRLQNDLRISPARFFRKMSFYLLNAIPRFTRPPEARQWLTFTAPVYDDLDYTVPEDYDASQELTIETGLLNFDLANAIKIQPDGYGEYEYIPVQITYDPETGDVTIPAGKVEAGDSISFDFYTDGYFDRNLGYEVRRILGLLVQIVWENRFANDFLLQQPKIKDRSFDVGSEANHMRASTERMKFLNEQVNQEMKSFEQNVEYGDVVDSKLPYPVEPKKSSYVGPDQPEDSFPNIWVDTDEDYDTNG